MAVVVLVLLQEELVDLVVVVLVVKVEIVQDLIQEMQDLQEQSTLVVAEALVVEVQEHLLVQDKEIWVVEVEHKLEDQVVVVDIL